MSASGVTPRPLDRWYRAVKADDFADIEASLADDAVFSSPAVFAPQAGRALVAKYLRAATAILNNPTFRYTGEWLAHDSAVLEFEVTIGETFVNGVDIIRWNAAGAIVDFKVMVRPLRGLNVLVALMGERLAEPST